jgi:hypothetical protein
MAPTLIKSISHFYTFDYNKVYFQSFKSQYFDNLIQLFLQPTTPLLLVLIYLLFSKLIFGYIRNIFKIKPKGGIDNFVAFHSFILAIYSGWTCYNSWSIVYNFINENDGTLNSALCDVEGKLWVQNNFSFWVLHFYLSKFYEFFDTWITILKGKKVSFLQEFHHAGIALSMWGFYVSSASVVLIIVTFNSFIHTIMYTYYTAASFGYRSPLKNYLTIAQIFQFILGMTISLGTHFYEGCLSSSQSFVLGITQIYTIILIMLFVWFYKEEYSSKKKIKNI